MNTNGVKCEWLVEPTRSEAKRNTVSAPYGVSQKKLSVLEEKEQTDFQMLVNKLYCEKGAVVCTEARAY